jgi:hypothetical protein
MSRAVGLLKFTIENDLDDIFAATLQLLKVIITIPMTTAEAERSFSTQKRIKTFLRSTMSEERLTALAMLSIEKKLLQDLPNFCDLVIDKFAANKERRIDFILKHCT